VFPLFVSFCVKHRFFVEKALAMLVSDLVTFRDFIPGAVWFSQFLVIPVTVITVIASDRPAAETLLSFELFEKFVGDYFAGVFDILVGWHFPDEPGEVYSFNRAVVMPYVTRPYISRFGIDQEQGVAVFINFPVTDLVSLRLFDFEQVPESTVEAKGLLAHTDGERGLVVIILQVTVLAAFLAIILQRIEPPYVFFAHTCYLCRLPGGKRRCKGRERFTLQFGMYLRTG
jgi:hypothetical protein